MKTRLLAALCGAAVAFSVLISCTDSVDGMPSGGSPAKPPQGGASDSYAAPEVPRDLQLSSYFDDPCVLVGADLLKSLGLDPAARASGSTRFAHSCLWRASNIGDNARLSLHLDSGRLSSGGMRGEYESYQGGWYAYWEPTTVNGYPAAFRATSDRRSDGVETIAVGVSGETVFSVVASSFLGSPDRAREVAEEVASEVLHTLTSGN